MSMELRTIQTFLKIVDLGSFTAAGNALNYVQSTITMQMQQLERELGAPLFDRIGKQVYLTELGRSFLPYANEIWSLTQQAGTLGKDLAQIRGNVRVGVLESLLFGTVADILPHYQNKYQNVDIQLKMGQAAELLTLLKQNQLDLAYVSTNLSDDPDLRCCYQRKENLVFLTTPEHPLAGKKKVPLDEVLAYPMIVTELSGICYSRLKKLAYAAGLMVHHSIVVDSTVFIADYLCKNGGVAFLPEYSVAKHLSQNKLVYVDADIPLQIYYSQIFCHKNKWISPFISGFIELVKDVRPETVP